MQAIQRKLIYLYCVAKVKPSRSNFKDIGVKIYPIYSQGIYAIVSKVSPDEFNDDNLKKNLTDRRWLEQKSRQHEKIIEEIMKDTTALPLEFGSVFQKEENIVKLLKERNTDFKRIIANLNGKEERNLKIYCDLKKFKATLEKEDERIKEKGKELASAGKAKAYFLKKKKDELTKDIIKEKIAEYTQDSFERLKRTTTEAKINKILSNEEAEKKDNVILNVAFLISKKRIKEFENVLDYLITKYSNKGIIFDHTGPLPPYNFCSIKKAE